MRSKQSERGVELIYGDRGVFSCCIFLVDKGKLAV